MPALTLIGRPDCHLCESARDVVGSVLAELGPETSVTLEELSILDDPLLEDRYRDEIPVLIIDGTVHAIWRIDADRLRTELSRPAS